MFKPPPEDPYDNIFTYFKEHGFVTAWSANICETSMYTQRPSIDKFFKNPPTDHENLSNNCDPHMYDYEADDGDW